MHTEQSKPTGSRLLDALELVSRNWLLVVVPFILLTGYMTVVMFIAVPVYTATATILPADNEDNSLSNALSGLVRVAGIRRPSGINSTLVFPEILKSRNMAKRILAGRYRSPGMEVKEGTLFEIFNIQELPEPERMETGIRLIQRRLQVQQDRITQMIELAVTTPDPVLSAEIAGAFVTELNTLYQEIQVKKARDNRRFLEARFEEISRQLQAAEKTLLAFNRQNAVIGSPDLKLEQGRLQREVRLQQQLYMTVSNQLEVAKIEEVKSRPVIQVLDTADPPLMKSGPPRRQRVMQAALLGLLLGLGLVFGREWVNKLLKNDPKQRSLKSLLPFFNRRGS